MTGTVRRWPLLLIASPAAVAVWSGWVGLGSICGFGMVHPLPGIWDGLRLNTAITLPIGVEAYGAYALGAWLTPGVQETARRFARWSAIGALALGMAGQVAYHLLAAEHARRAPWLVVTLVSCLPVVTLGFGAALTHLLRQAHSRNVPEAASETVPATAPVSAPEHAPVGVPGGVPGAVPKARPRPARALPDSASRKRGVHAPEAIFAAELETGTVPSIRAIKRQCRVGQPRAREIRNGLAVLAETRSQAPVPEPA